MLEIKAPSRVIQAFDTDCVVENRPEEKPDKHQSFLGFEATVFPLLQLFKFTFGIL